MVSLALLLIVLSFDGYTEHALPHVYATEFVRSAQITEDAVLFGMMATDVAIHGFKFFEHEFQQIVKDHDNYGRIAFKHFKAKDIDLKSDRQYLSFQTEILSPSIAQASYFI